MLYSAARLAGLLVVALGVAPSSSFTAVTYARPTTAACRLSPLRLSELAPAAVDEDCGCADAVAGVVVPTGSSSGVTMNGVRVTGRTLRSTELVDSNGVRQSVGSVIGNEGKAVVVFLRHLGWHAGTDGTHTNERSS